MPRLLVVRGLRENDKQPGIGLAFTQLRVEGESGRENHRTPASPPVGRVSAEQGACVRLNT
jgi:hypothetical protein